MEHIDDEVERLDNAVAALQTKLNRADRATARALNVGSAEDLQVLRLLLGHGPLRAGVLGKKQASSATTISGRINRLEKKGFVQRERIAGDLRAMLVKLTEAGKEAATRSRNNRLDALEEIAAGFPLESLEALIEAMPDGVEAKAA